MRNISLLLALLFLCSFSETSLIKRISDVQFRYEFYTTTKKVSPRAGRSYYWFKGGAIHNSEYGAAGELLQDNYSKYYHSNQLAEAGVFKNGLKEGKWKAWYENGTLQSETYYNAGLKHGTYSSYDLTGAPVEKGKYKNNLKTGKWINYVSKDTLKYREGSVLLPKVKKQKNTNDSISGNRPGFFRRLLGKKDKETAVVAPKADSKAKVVKGKATTVKKTPTSNNSQKVKQQPADVPKAHTKKEIKTKPAATENSENKTFWNRLFSKKQVKN